MKALFHKLVAWLIAVTAKALIPKIPPQSGPNALAQAILKYNNGLKNFLAGPVWTNGVSTLHKIGVTDAEKIASAISAGVARYSTLTTSYVCACLGIESALDPKAENKNTSGSNPENDPMGYDEGIAQIKLRYIVSEGVNTVEERMAFALDIDKAIDYHCALMQTHAEQAKAIIANNTSSAPDPRLANPFLLASGIYNFGLEGMTKRYEAGEFPHHCQMVADIENVFATALGVVPLTASPT